MNTDDSLCLKCLRRGSHMNLSCQDWRDSWTNAEALYLRMNVAHPTWFFA